jgi:alkylhydroperoxidase family enzyme
VHAVLADLDAAPISEPLRAMLKFLRHVTRSAVTTDDVRVLRASGVTRAQIDDALAICWAFNVINRLGDAFGFAVPGPAAFAASAKMLLARGYKM